MKKYTGTIAIVLLALICVRLGFWQLDRAEQKKQVISAVQARGKLPPLSAADLNQTFDQLNHRQVKLQGTLDWDHLIYLDNQVEGGRIGYQVLVPFQLTHQKLVLINLGWIAAEQDRSRLPVVRSFQATPVLGRISHWPTAPPFVKPDRMKEWPARLISISRQELERVLKKPVYSFVILLDPSMDRGLVRNWHFINMSPTKHQGYALQWFSFAGVLLIGGLAAIMRTRH